MFYSYRMSYKTLFWSLFGYGDETETTDIIEEYVPVNISVDAGNDTVFETELRKDYDHKV